MVKITVLLPIVVPEGKYCWGPWPDYEICGYFSNEGGHSTCAFLWDIKDEKHGWVLKSERCLSLKEV